MNELGSCKVTTQAPTFVITNPKWNSRTDNKKEYCRADDIIGVQQDRSGGWNITVRELTNEYGNYTGKTIYSTYKISDEVAQQLNLIG